MFSFDMLFTNKFYIKKYVLLYIAKESIVGKSLNKFPER